jgi:hypothetical protein
MNDEVLRVPYDVDTLNLRRGKSFSCLGTGVDRLGFQLLKQPSDVISFFHMAGGPGGREGVYDA